MKAIVAGLAGVALVVSFQHLQCIVAPYFDEVPSYNPQELSICLPRLKDKLGNRYDILVKALNKYHESIRSNQDWRLAHSVLNETVKNALQPAEHQQLRAIIACHDRGLFSYGSKDVVVYLNLSDKEAKNVTDSINKYLWHIEDKIFSREKLEPGDQDSIALEIMKVDHEKYSSMIYKNLPAHARETERVLAGTYDMKQVMKNHVWRVFHQAVFERDNVARLRRNRPNLTHQFTSNLLLLADEADFQNTLGLSPEQKEAVCELLDRCLDIMNEHQLSYHHFLVEAKRDPTTYYVELATTISSEYDRDFTRILNNQQKIRLLQIRCQLFGTNYAFNEKTAPILGISKDQQDKLLDFASKLREQNPEVFKKLRGGPEDIFFVKQFRSKAIYDSFFDSEQRKRWDKLLGEKLSEETLKKLALKFYHRTRPKY
jgi:hypothetical protein